MDVWCLCMLCYLVCSAVTVECCVCTRVAWVCLVCLLLCIEEGSSPASLQLLRGGIWMGLYAVPLSISLLAVGMGTVLAKQYLWYYVIVKISFKNVR